MKQMVIAVCEDEQIFLQDIVQNIERYAAESNVEIFMEKYESAKKMIDAMKAGVTYDMTFSDIEMPDMDGVTAARLIREMNIETSICFATCHDGYARDAYEVDALSYISKPICYDDVRKVIDKASMIKHYNSIIENENRISIDIVTNSEHHKIFTDDIVYVEKKRNQCIIHTRVENIMVYDTLKNFYEKLDGMSFYYTHQGYIVNIRHIRKLGRNAIDLDNGRVIPLSRKHYEMVKKAFISVGDNPSF